MAMTETAEEIRERLQQALQNKHDRYTISNTTDPNLGVSQPHGDLHNVTGGSPFNEPALPKREPFSNSHKPSIKTPNSK